jgi:serine protease inhibitor
MKFSFSALLMIALLALFAACDGNKVDPDPPQAETQGPYADLARANGDFCWKLMQQLHSSQPDENVFISPTSIATALAMTANGAEGNTRDEIYDVFEWNAFSPQQLNEAFQSMLYDLENLDPDTRLDLANSIWYREDFPFKQAFLQVNDQYYEAEIRPEDFADPGLVNRINDWASDNTQGKIKEVIDQVKPEHIMFLMNAIYFKGSWQEEFDKSLTQKATFTREDGREVEVDMMELEKEWQTAYTDLGTLVDLPYGNGAYSMSVLLPKAGVSLDSVLLQLNQLKWEDWTDDLSGRELTLYLPKLELEYSKQLKEELIALGMPEAFSSQADFSAMTDADPVYLDFVKHDSYVKVDEKGTEAAAVTTVGIIRTNLPPTIRVNRPYLFVIRERSTNNLLFAGKVMDPS